MTSEIAHEWKCMLKSNSRWEAMYSTTNCILDGHLWMWWGSISFYWNLLLLTVLVEYTIDESRCSGWHFRSLRINLIIKKKTKPKSHSRRTDDTLCPIDWDEINWLFLQCVHWKFKRMMIAKKGKSGWNFFSSKQA